jgi:putative ABC transport system permease protein
MPLNLPDLLAATGQSLWSNKLRSTLTTLSMFMGVAAVTATLHVRSISQAVIAAELAQRSAPQVGIGLEWSPRRERTPLRAEETEFLLQRLPGVKAVSAINWTGQVSTLFEGTEASPVMIAVSRDFLLTEGYQMKAGRFFTDTDFERFYPVAVIDQFLSDRLFQGKNPVGQRIYARNRPYTVVGVVPTRKNTEEEPSGQIYIPLAIYSAITADSTVDSILVRPLELRQLEAIAKQAKDLLKQGKPNRRFWDFSNADDLLQQQEMLDMASQALAVVALISLLIGGVGIANVMIGTVAERTPEIGLRRAIGATRRDIMLQFILEAASLSLIGGIAALATVHGLTLATANTFKLPYQFEVGTGAIALTSALLVGIGAGLPPALRASQLDPVKALHAE